MKRRIKSGLSRSEYVAKAIESFATGSNQANLELHTAQLELNKSQVEVYAAKPQDNEIGESASREG